MQNPIKLAHAHCPETLRISNQQLTALLQDDSADPLELARFIEQRAMLVENLLEEMQKQTQTQNSDVRAFAEAELAINQTLQSHVEILRAKAQQDIVDLSKNRKAIGEYTGQHVKLHHRAPSSK